MWWFLSEMGIEGWAIDTMASFPHGKIEISLEHLRFAKVNQLLE